MRGAVIPLCYDPRMDEYEGYEMTDVEADSDTLTSAGWGTDEDYGYFGPSDFEVDIAWDCDV